MFTVRQTDERDTYIEQDTQKKKTIWQINPFA